jgi:hypothetical protein
MAMGRKTGGRVAGTPNKLTSTAKDTIAQCGALMEKNGKSLYEWVLKDEKNEYAFWTVIYPKLLPLQITGDEANPVQVVKTIRLIDLTSE